ncbi:GNAT family N-acetyltransferase [Brevibacterium sp.]|uniref:GNAT family N-acetyltransferase n=1 Tax=Brevibacterium sp. TaxID=1701 RepID=UPI00281206DA|nr:GNAT family N-acetyltransferase [Brevibacterium sp.]
MTEALKDSTGAEVTVELDEAGKSYAITLESGEVAGRAHFVASPDSATERIFYHTEVNKQFGGRGLSKVLVAQAMEDSREQGFIVVPVCPLFSRWVQEHGDDYLAEGGKFRNATGADFAVVEKLT